MSEQGHAYRPLTHDEVRVLRAFVQACTESIAAGFAMDGDLPRVRARDLDDGGGGSIALCMDGVEAARGTFAAEMQYNDTDGAPVLVSLYVSAEGVPTSLEFWRAGEGPRQSIPTVLPAVVLARDVR